MDDRVGEHLVLGRFGRELEREDGDVHVYGDVLEPDLVRRRQVRPQVEVVQESTLHAEVNEKKRKEGK